MGWVFRLSGGGPTYWGNTYTTRSNMKLVFQTDLYTTGKGYGGQYAILGNMTDRKLTDQFLFNLIF